MKHTFKGSELAHIWASSQEVKSRPIEKRYGKSGENFSFRGDTIYSYSMPIGQRMFYKGVEYFVMNSGRASNTTSKHQGKVASALIGASVFSIALGRIPYSGRWPDIKFTPKELRDHYIDVIKNKIIDVKLSRFRRLTMPQAYILSSKLTNLNRLMHIFFNDIRLNVKQVEIVKEAEQFLKEYREKSEIRESLREKRNQEKREKQRLEQIEKTKEKAVFYGLDPDNIDPIQFFRLTGDAQLIQKDSLVYLRIHNDNVVTSLGAIVPLQSAMALYRLVKAGEVKGGERCGPYSVNEMSNNTLVIGCHYIKLEEIKSFIEFYNLDK
jgi:hypothetical protein